MSAHIHQTETSVCCVRACHDAPSSPRLGKRRRYLSDHLELTGVTGTFCLDESFDHVVRSEKQYWRLVRYNAENPAKAGLRGHA